MAYYENLPIYKEAYDTALYFENIVKGFSRYDKYTLGSELRNLSREVLKLIVKANASQSKRKAHLIELRENLEILKTVIRLCKDVKAFNNFNSYEFAATKVVSMAKQNEGWLKSADKS